MPSVLVDLGVHESPYGGPFQYGRALLEGISQQSDASQWCRASVQSNDARIDHELQHIGIPWQRSPEPTPRQLHAVLAIWQRPAPAPSVQVIHGTSNLVTLRTRARKIVTIHDLIQAFPCEGEQIGLPRRLYVAARALGYKCNFAMLGSRVDRIVTVHPAQKQMIEEYLAPKHPVTVAYTPIPSVYLQEQLPVVERSAGEVILLASKDFRKNIAAGVRALAQCRVRPQRITLVVASASLAAWAHQLPFPAGVPWQVVVEPTELELQALIARAAVLLFPSLAEGFGMPMYQALCCGTTVVGKDDLLIPELAHLRHGGFWGCDTRSESEIARATDSALQFSGITSANAAACRDILRRVASARTLGETMRRIYSEVYAQQ